MSAPQKRSPAKSLALAAARVAAERKGEDIVLLNVARLSSLADYLLIVSATSPAHLEALEEKIEQAFKARGVYALHHDGRRSDAWRVLDYGGLMIHLMRPEAREFYGIERVFRGARSLRLKDA